MLHCWPQHACIAPNRCTLCCHLLTDHATPSCLQVSSLAGDPQEQAAAGAALQTALATLATAKAQLKALEGTIPADVSFDEQGNILSYPGQEAAGSSSSSNGAQGPGAVYSNGTGAHANGMPPPGLASVVQKYMNGSRNGSGSSSNGASLVNGNHHEHRYATGLGNGSSNGLYAASNGAASPSSNGVYAAGAGSSVTSGAAAGSSDSSSSAGGQGEGEGPQEGSSAAEASSQQQPAQQDSGSSSGAAPKLKKAGKRKLWLNGKLQSVEDD